MDMLLYALYTLAFAWVTGHAMRIAVRSKNIGSWLLVVVSAAMIFENSVLALGEAFGFGTTLETLSWMRFLGLALFPPLLIITGFEMVHRCGLPWARLTWVRISVGLLTAALMIIGLIQLGTIQLVPKTVNDVVRYVASPKLPPPIPVIVMSLIIIGFGFAIYRRTGAYLLLVGGIFLLLGDALAAGVYSLGSAVETVFMVVMLVTEMWVVRHTSEFLTAAAEKDNLHAVAH